MRSFNSRIGALILLVALGSSALIVSGSLTRILELHHSTFNETSWFPVLQDLYINTGEGLMYLSKQVIPYENFNTYSEVGDTQNRITPTGSNITYVEIKRSYAAHSYHVVNAGDFIRYLMFKVTEIEAGDADQRNGITYLAFTTSLGTTTYLETSARCIYLDMVQDNANDDAYRLQLVSKNNGVTDGVATSAYLNVGTSYYLKYRRVASMVYLDIFSDPAFSVLVSGISITCNTFTMNYFQVVTAQARATDPDDWVTGWIYNLTDTLGGLNLEGVAYSQDLLGNETDPGAAYSLMANHTQGAGGSLSIEVSPDNSTWSPAIVATSGGVHYSRIEALNYTSLYCRVNLTSLGVTNTVLNDFYFTHLYEVAPLPEPEGLDLMYLLAAVICVGLGALVTQAHKPR